MEKITEINCETGEVIERDATPEEIATREESARIEAEEAAVRESALSKLKALGLTDAEIAAILS
jgi:hypothetical protein